jgi:DNA-binding Xre family transcriptional regulator
MFSYKPLLIQLVKKEMTKTQLRQRTGISMATLAKISKNEYVSMEVLDKICKTLDCGIEDVIEHIKEG